MTCIGNKMSERNYLAHEIRDLILAQKHLPLDQMRDSALPGNLFYALLRYEDFALENAFAALQGGTDYTEYPENQYLEKLFDNSKKFVDNENAITLQNFQKTKQRLDRICRLAKELIQYNSSAGEPEEILARDLTETVYVANGQLNAQMTKLFLESLGIQSRILEESAGIVYGITLGPMGEAEIRVTKEDAEQAREILKAMEAGLFSLPDDNSPLEDDETIEDDLE
jgi:hypothetical protein